MAEDAKSLKAVSSSPYLEKNQAFTSPYRSGIKDKNFVNPSLISHDVFYNQDYPKVERSIPYCRKRQSITEKITNNPRALTPEPLKSCGENERRSYASSIRNTPVHQTHKSGYLFENGRGDREHNEIRPVENNFMSFNDAGKDEHNDRAFDNIEKPLNDPIKLDDPPQKHKGSVHERPQKPNSFIEKAHIHCESNCCGGQEIASDPNGPENQNYAQDQFDRVSEKSATTFTRNKNNLICDYCINNDIIQHKREEKRLEMERNKHLKKLNEEVYRSMLAESSQRETERKRLIRDTKQAQLQTIETKRNNFYTERNNALNFERETIRLQEEEAQLMREREAELERNRRAHLRKELDLQIDYKRKERQEELSERNSGNVTLNIDNQYYNPYLPKRREYIEEIERQKSMNREKNNKEKEEQRKNYLLNMEIQKKIVEQDERQRKEDLKRKQEYAQRILQDIEAKRKREQLQKETELSHYRSVFDKQREEEKNLSLQQFYDKKLREARMAQSLKDQMFAKQSFAKNNEQDEKVRRDLAQIEDLLAAQKIKNYNCMKCHKNLPKSVLNLSKSKNV